MYHWSWCWSLLCAQRHSSSTMSGTLGYQWCHWHLPEGKLRLAHRKLSMGASFKGCWLFHVIWMILIMKLNIHGGPPWSSFWPVLHGCSSYDPSKQCPEDHISGAHRLQVHLCKSNPSDHILIYSTSKLNNLNAHCLQMRGAKASSSSHLKSEHFGACFPLCPYSHCSK